MLGNVQAKEDEEDVGAARGRSEVGDGQPLGVPVGEVGL